MEERIEVTANDQHVLNNIERDYENITQTADFLNIAIIGKTGSGKSSFLNAFRGLSNNEGDAAIESADSEGFMDNNNTDIEIFLEKIKKEYNIVEFDAIIFVTKDRLSNQELKIAKKNAGKDVMLFFVYNQVDKFYQDYLKVNNKEDINLSLIEQVKKNEKMLKEGLEKNQKIINALIENHGVFHSLMQDIEKFSAENLKSGSYKRQIIEESVYLITSNKKCFEDILLSKDGKRLKSEIENHLVLSKFNNFNIDLFDPFSKRTIYLKKKIILKNLFDGKKLRIAGAAFSSIIPLLDIWPTNSINKTYKSEFFEKFGMKALRDRINQNPSSVSKDPNKIETIKIIFKKIESDESIKSLDKIFDTSSIHNIESLRERIKQLINNILPTLGLTAASLTDDFIAKFCGYAVAITTKSLILLSLISVPISIVIYLFLLRRGVERILIRYEEYALILLKLLSD
ncbi:unnamed protein product [Brachionus calyciflorus]|uniref:IRG-type G domain-containing protein n=1 Tax=Brachionus calyciflorus TaxID=104777 RepID=A0A814KSZ0_9BILA|nr:unnamed protein product [Brachionus calyciflorus]